MEAEPTTVIQSGPGWLEPNDSENLAADTSLAFSDLYVIDGDSIISLLAYANLDGRITSIGIELTRGDLVTLRDFISQALDDIDDIEAIDATLNAAENARVTRSLDCTGGH